MTRIEGLLAKVTHSLFAPLLAGAVRRPFSVLMGLMPRHTRHTSRASRVSSLSEVLHLP